MKKLKKLVLTLFVTVTLTVLAFTFSADASTCGWNLYVDGQLYSETASYAQTGRLVFEKSTHKVTLNNFYGKSIKAIPTQRPYTNQDAPVLDIVVNGICSLSGESNPSNSWDSNYYTAIYVAPRTSACGTGSNSRVNIYGSGTLSLSNNGNTYTKSETRNYAMIYADNIIVSGSLNINVNLNVYGLNDGNKNVYGVYAMKATESLKLVNSGINTITVSAGTYLPSPYATSGTESYAAIRAMNAVSGTVELGGSNKGYTSINASAPANMGTSGNCVNANSFKLKDSAYPIYLKTDYACNAVSNTTTVENSMNLRVYKLHQYDSTSKTGIDYMAVMPSDANLMKNPSVREITLDTVLSSLTIPNIGDPRPQDDALFITRSEFYLRRTYTRTTSTTSTDSLAYTTIENNQNYRYSLAVVPAPGYVVIGAASKFTKANITASSKLAIAPDNVVFSYEKANSNKSDFLRIDLRYTYSKPVITTQPKNATISGNGTNTFSVTATGANLTYTWYYINKLKPDGAEIPSNSRIYKNITTKDLTIHSEKTGLCSCNGTKLYCVISNKYGSVKTNAATLTVNHVWDSGVVKTKATCGKTGTKLFTCTAADCTATETRIIPATGNHTSDAGTVTKAATCSATGEKVYKCKTCSTELKKETLPKTDHEDDGTYYMYSDGYHCLKCKYCKKVLSTSAHIRKETVTKQPTCTAEGEKTITCSVCKNTLGTEKIDKKYHESDGKYYFYSNNFHCLKCKDCKTVITTSAHIKGDPVIKEPTCTAEGEKKYTCYQCGFDMGTEKIDKKYHESDGKYYFYSNNFHCLKCKDCKEVITTSAHIKGDPVVTKEPTCTAEGERNFTCYQCGSDMGTEKIPTIPHIYETAFKWSEDSTSAICDYHCRNCEAAGTVNCEIKDGITVPATLTEDGFIGSAATAVIDGKEYTDAKSDAKLIAKISKISLSKTGYTYDGKAHAPALTISDSNGKKLKKDTDYTVKYKNASSKNVGNYTVTVTFKGNYSGSQTLKYTINPALKVSDVKTASVKLTWTKVGGAAQYLVYGSTDGGKTFKKIATVKTNSYTHSKLTAGKKYQYKVIATASNGNKIGTYSAVAKVSTLCKTPALSSLKSSKSKTATVSWGKVTGASKYIVYKSTDGKKWTKVATTTKTSYTLTKLTGGKRIYVKVVAVNADGKNSSASPYKYATVKK